MNGNYGENLMEILTFHSNMLQMRDFQQLLFSLKQAILEAGSHLSRCQHL